MTRTTLAAELNTFVKGLITEATPLTFPANASLDEDNFVLNRQGSRQRRFGMNFEEDFLDISSGVALPFSGEVAMTQFRWKNAGGIPQQDILVIQTAGTLQFFNLNTLPISQNLLATYAYTEVGVGANLFSYAVVDGLLVIATGSKNITVIEYVAPATFNFTFKRLLVRDLFGVSDIYLGENLRVGTSVATRPASLTDNHKYNLRNQTWGPPRKVRDVEVITDPITEMFDTAGVFPSNADAVTYSLYADANDGDDRLTERFWANDLQSNPSGTYPAAKGFFVIDALDRGSSRVSEYAKLLSNNPELDYAIASLPVDSTPGGALCVTEYAGRVFYAGFPGDIIDGDDHSPRMASYVLFSNLVEDPSDITNCYQEGDPTSRENPELLDSDGGFIRIDGAYGITQLINVSNALMVLAHNGVWMIQGGSGFGFKATDYLVTKLTDRGSDSPGATIVVDKSLLYWSDDGIYSVAPSQVGDYEASNLTRNTIQTFYDRIPADQRVAARGVYDTYEQKVRWVFSNLLGNNDEARELVLDLTLGAFYTNSIKNVGNVKRPALIGGFTVPAFRAIEVEDEVTVDNILVTVSGSPVEVTQELFQPNLREVMYVAVTGTSPVISYTFSHYRDTGFRDWRSFDLVGVDAPAFLLTGWLAGDDYQRYKQVPSITFHFNKTETGFITDVNGDFTPVNPSSCLVSAQWDWANSVNSGQWSRSFQAYRHRRHYIPADITDTFNNGYATVESKNRLRGKGKVLSLRMETEPDKDCQLLGWSMVMTGNGNV